jgi:hypothetical protein
MKPSKKKATKRTATKFKDLKSKADPKGGSFSWGASQTSTVSAGKANKGGEIKLG